jgi:heptosyltransferase-2
MSSQPVTLVMAPNWLGDAVMALPAIADLKRHAPATRLTVAARPSVVALFELASDVDATVTLEWRGRVLSRAGLHADIERLRNLDASQAVLLPNSFASAWLVHQAGVPERVGYATDWRSFLLSRAVQRPDASVHQGEYYQHLVRALGVATGPLEPRLEVSLDDQETARALLVAHGWDTLSTLVVLAPGAAYGTAKQWLPSHYAALAASLVTTPVNGRGVACVLIGGHADAATTALVRTSVTEGVRARVLDLAGATSLRSLAGVFRLAAACVSNDSGAMHVAAAVGTPLVALFGATNERETSPLAWHDRPARVLVNPVWCRPCMRRQCPIDHRCMTGLLPTTVLSVVEDVVSEVVSEVPSQVRSEKAP